MIGSGRSERHGGTYFENEERVGLSESRTGREVCLDDVDSFIGSTLVTSEFGTCS